KEKLADAVTNKQAAEAARVQSTLALENIGTSLNEARSKTDAANAVLNEKRMTAATSEERRRSAVSALRRVENESKELESRLAVQHLELTDAEARIKTLHAEITDITDRIAGAGDAIESENTELID